MSTSSRLAVTASVPSVARRVAMISRWLYPSESRVMPAAQVHDEITATSPRRGRVGSDQQVQGKVQSGRHGRRDSSGHPRQDACPERGHWSPLATPQCEMMAGARASCNTPALYPEALPPAHTACKVRMSYNLLPARNHRVRGDGARVTDSPLTPVTTHDCVFGQLGRKAKSPQLQSNQLTARHERGDKCSR